MAIVAGTSGYSYKEWKGAFYPDDLKASEMLSYYAERLPAVEINNTFYRLPKESVIESWAGQVPDGFRFAIKASRRITHMKRLKEPVDETNYLLDVLGSLGDKLGVVLFQLPPNFKQDLDRLKAFLDLVDGRVKPVFEYRHESWFADETYEILRDANCALCISDVDDEPDPEVISTADFGYLRLRRMDYSKAKLKSWLKKVHDQTWSDAYVFFKHEDAGAGPKLAGEFLKLAE